MTGTVSFLQGDEVDLSIDERVEGECHVTASMRQRSLLHVMHHTSHVPRHTSRAGIEELRFRTADLVKRFDVGDAGDV